MFQTPTSFVFTHHDLAPCNIIVDKNDNLWLVDWGKSARTQSSLRIHCHAKFSIGELLQAIEQHRITVLPGPPTIYQTLLDHPARGDYDLSSLRFAVTGAATVPVVLVEPGGKSELDIDIVLTAYGLTEANGMGHQSAAPFTTR